MLENRRRLENRLDFGGWKIDGVKVTKSHGVKIDKNLSWNVQVNQGTKKFNAGLSILRRLREIVDYRTLITIYQSIIQPQSDYCLQVWDCLGRAQVYQTNYRSSKTEHFE